MYLFVILALASASSCTVFQSTLIRKEPKRLELIRTGNYSAYLEKFKGVRTTTGFTTNVYRADYEYSQKVFVGFPEQEAMVWLSTQTSMMWVPHVDCHTHLTCKSKHKFAPDKSKTFVPSDKKWEAISYGGTASGVIGSDRVKIDGIGKNFSITRIEFGLAMSIESDLLEIESDGVLGLAFAQYNGTNTEPFIKSALEQADLKPLFTVWLMPKMVDSGVPGGVITYGSIDSANCGPIFKYETLSSPNSYQYMIDGISMGSFKSTARSSAEQDLGTWIVAPPAIVSKLAQIAKAEYQPEVGVYTIDCNAQFPSLEITSGSTVYTIKAEHLVFELDTNLCLFAFAPVEPSGLQSTFNFGIPFKRQYCTVFDIGNKRLGFAESYPDGPRSTSAVSTKAPTTRPTTQATQRPTHPDISTKPTRTKQPLMTTTSKNAHSSTLVMSFLFSILAVYYYYA